MQTRHVLSNTEVGPGAAARMLAVGEQLHQRTGKTAGNGSLMRTSPVALAHLGDPDAIEDAARKISALTHFDPMAGDACVLWSLAIDHAIDTGKLDVRIGLPRVDASWAALIDEAEREQPRHFARKSGWVVAAFQQAWSSIVHRSSLEDGLQAAAHGGGDTDTVAAIAGGLMGAAYGGSAVPARWRRVVFGWPDNIRARDLTRLAVLAARSGKPDSGGWPSAPTTPSRGNCSSQDHGAALGSPRSPA